MRVRLEAVSLLRNTRGNGCGQGLPRTYRFAVQPVQLAGVGLVEMMLCAAAVGWLGLIVGIRCAIFVLLSVTRLVRDSRKRAASRQ